MILSFIDVETTGLLQEDRICEIAGLFISSADTSKKKLIRDYCNPHRKISLQAMAVNNITDEMVADAPDFDKTDVFSVLSQVNSKDNLLIAHNAKTDLSFLEKEDLKVNMLLVDTMRCAEHLYLGKLESFSLQYLRYALKLYKGEKKACIDLGLERANSHSAGFDVVITYLLFKHLLGKVNNLVSTLIKLTSTYIPYTKLNFGKYNGSLIDEVAKFDRKYLIWVLNEYLNEDKFPDMYYVIQQAIS